MKANKSNAPINGFVYLIFYLNVAHTVYGVILSIIADQYIPLLFAFAFVSCFGLLLFKRKALYFYLMAGIALLEAYANARMFETTEGEELFTFIMRMAFVSLILLIRKNGISAWKVIIDNSKDPVPVEAEKTVDTD